MNRADARAGEHRCSGLGDHRHVDHDAVAALDAALLQEVRYSAGLFVEIAIGPALAVTRLIGLEDQRGAIAMLRKVPVEAIDREIELAVRIPFDVEIIFAK